MKSFLEAAATASILGTLAIYSVASAGVCFHYRASAQRAGVRMSVSGLIGHALPHDLLLSRWTRLDLIYYVINRILVVLLYPSLTIITTNFSASVHYTLQSHFGQAQRFPTSYLGFGLFLIIGLLIRDFASFAIHYIQHRIPVLWEFHKVHHAPESLVPPTGHRLHPFDQILGVLTEAPLLGLIVGVYAWLSDQQLPQLILSSVGFYTIANILTFAPLRHSHIDLRLGRLERFLLSPAHHRLHHSVEPPHWDKNFAAIFPFWDWVCGTLHAPPPAHTYRLGLPDGASEKYTTILACYLGPCRSVLCSIRKHGFRSLMMPTARPSSPHHMTTPRQGGSVTPEPKIATN